MIALLGAVVSMVASKGASRNPAGYFFFLSLLSHLTGILYKHTGGTQSAHLEVCTCDTVWTSQNEHQLQHGLTNIACFTGYTVTVEGRVDIACR